MKKSELLKALSTKVEGLTQKQADEFLKALVGVVTEVLVAGEEVTIPDLVRLGSKERAEREGINPKTQEKITIPSKVVPVVKATKSLKDALLK